MDKEKQLNYIGKELDNFGKVITNVEDLIKYQKLSEDESKLFKEVMIEKAANSIKNGIKHFSIDNNFQNRSIKVELKKQLPTEPIYK